MKRSKFTEQQIAFALQQAESGTQVADMPQDGHLGSGILSLEATLWRLDAIRVKKLRQLEEENGRLRKVVADLTLDKEMLQEVIRRKL
jgi:putative transposase